MSKSDREQPTTRGLEVQPMTSDERIVRANGVDLCVPTFGDPADLAILLVASSREPGLS